MAAIILQQTCSAAREERRFSTSSSALSTDTGKSEITMWSKQTMLFSGSRWCCTISILGYLLYTRVFVYSRASPYFRDPFATTCMEQLLSLVAIAFWLLCVCACTTHETEFHLLHFQQTTDASQQNDDLPPPPSVTVPVSNVSESTQELMCEGCKKQIRWLDARPCCHTCARLLDLTKVYARRQADKSASTSDLPSTFGG